MPGQVRGDDMMAVTELPGASANATVRGAFKKFCNLA